MYSEVLWSIFSRIRTEYGSEKLGIRTFFTQWYSLAKYLPVSFLLVKQVKHITCVYINILILFICSFLTMFIIVQKHSQVKTWVTAPSPAKLQICRHTFKFEVSEVINTGIHISSVASVDYVLKAMNKSFRLMC